VQSYQNLPEFAPHCLGLPQFARICHNLPKIMLDTRANCPYNTRVGRGPAKTCALANNFKQPRKNFLTSHRYCTIIGADDKKIVVVLLLWRKAKAGSGWFSPLKSMTYKNFKKFVQTSKKSLTTPSGSGIIGAIGRL
jgi:hypothetical protein